MNLRRLRWTAGAALSLALVATAAPVSAAPSAPTPPPKPGKTAAKPAGPTDTIAPKERDKLLPKGWRKSADRAWTTTGDADGFHILTATAAGGYTWKTVATLVEPGFDTDMWIGNACLTGSGRKLVVVYAPRTFTNDLDLFDRGGFTAVVDLVTGKVTKLPVQSTLAYFNPGCGADDKAVVSQFAGTRADQPGGKAQTRLSTIDTAAGRITKRTLVAGEVSSAVPAGPGIVAAGATSLLSIQADGGTRKIADTGGVPFRLTPDRSGGLVFMDRSGDRARVRRTLRQAGAKTSTLATGAVTDVGLTADGSGQIYVTGRAERSGALPPEVRVANVPVDSTLSSNGRFAVTKVSTVGTDTDTDTAPGLAEPVRIEAKVLDTDAAVTFGVVPGDGVDPEAGRAAHPSLSAPAAKAGPSARAATSGSPSSQIEDERYCSVPRNDPANQALQPKPRQVEWAVDQAITDSLTVQRPANWKNLGMPAYTPQGLFPSIPLEGGGRVPAQIMLGIIAQESNMWQAPRFILPGMTGNPLIGNYYGRNLSNTTSSDDWVVNWEDADCGYGVAQVTDGMRRAGREKPGETALPEQAQRAVALDYAANVAAGLRILQDKWNQVYRSGMRIHDGDPSSLENWFFAIWAYNSGFHPDLHDGQPWGVGWGNNPINPRFDPQRKPFLMDDRADAKNPQRWPYQEKVLGWAGFPVEINESESTVVAGYRQAWWTTVQNKRDVKPNPTIFCGPNDNDCYPGQLQKPTAPGVSSDPPGPCMHQNGLGEYDLKCWFHASIGWKSSAGNPCTTCGHEVLRFDPGWEYQQDGNSFPPACDRAGLPANAVIIDDVPDKTPVVRGGCTAQSSPGGSFALNFGSDDYGDYPSKVDFHQIGGGFNGHFWNAYTYTDGDRGGSMKVTGTWIVKPTHAWTRIFVHLPKNSTWTHQADYKIYRPGDSTPSQHRTIPTRWEEHKWVDIGVFDFRTAGTPMVELSNVTKDGKGIHKISWDAIAVQPLAGQPRHQIVAMGDSFSAGEGADEYTRVSDQYGNDADFKDACRRSPQAWGPSVVLPGTPNGKTLDALKKDWDPNVDFQHIACAGARTHNVMATKKLDGSPAPANASGQLPNGTQGEVTQLDSGFVDRNTTLVMLSIGGNDAGWSDVVQGCLPEHCVDPNFSVPNFPAPVTESVPRRIRDVVKPDVNRVVAEIRERAPNAWILLVGYPRLLKEGSDLSVAVPPDLVWGLSRDEVDFLNDMARVAATELLPADMQHKVAAVDVRTYFDGHEIGWGFDNYLNSYNVGDKFHEPDDDGEADSSKIGAGSFHPNVDGYQAYRRAVEDLLPVMNYRWS